MKRQLFKEADGGKEGHFQFLCTARREGWVGAGTGIEGGEKKEEAVNLGTMRGWGEPIAVHLR